MIETAPMIFNPLPSKVKEVYLRKLNGLFLVFFCYLYPPFFFSFLDFSPFCLENNIIHLFPVQSYNFSDKSLTKCLLNFSLNEISILLFENQLDCDKQEDKLREKLSDVEKKIGEIKDTNQFLTPYQVRTIYPVMYNINVFSLIKKIEDHRKKTITSLKNVKNEISFIQFIQERQDYELDEDYKEKLVELFTLKKDLIKEILVLQSAYSMIDTMFLQEIKNADVIKRRCCRSCKNCCEPTLVDPEKINPFIAQLIDPFKRNDIIERQESSCCGCFGGQKKIIKKKDVGCDKNDDDFWFRSDENHCKDGRCGIKLARKKSMREIENDAKEINIEMQTITKNDVDGRGLYANGGAKNGGAKNGGAKNDVHKVI